MSALNRTLTLLALLPVGVAGAACETAPPTNPAFSLLGQGPDGENAEEGQNGTGNGAGSDPTAPGGAGGGAGGGGGGGGGGSDGSGGPGGPVMFPQGPQFEEGALLPWQALEDTVDPAMLYPAGTEGVADGNCINHDPYAVFGRGGDQVAPLLARKYICDRGAFTVSPTGELIERTFQDAVTGGTLVNNHWQLGGAGDRYYGGTLSDGTELDVPSGAVVAGISAGSILYMVPSNGEIRMVTSDGTEVLVLPPTEGADFIIEATRSHKDGLWAVVKSDQTKWSDRIVADGLGSPREHYYELWNIWPDGRTARVGGYPVMPGEPVGCQLVPSESSERRDCDRSLKGGLAIDGQGRLYAATLTIPNGVVNVPPILVWRASLEGERWQAITFDSGHESDGDHGLRFTTLFSGDGVDWDNAPPLPEPSQMPGTAEFPMDCDVILDSEKVLYNGNSLGGWTRIGVDYFGCELPEALIHPASGDSVSLHDNVVMTAAGQFRELASPGRGEDCRRVNDDGDVYYVSPTALLYDPQSDVVYHHCTPPGCSECAGRRWYNVAGDVVTEGRLLAVHPNGTLLEGNRGASSEWELRTGGTAQAINWTGVATATLEATRSNGKDWWLALRRGDDYAAAVVDTMAGTGTAVELPPLPDNMTALFGGVDFFGGDWALDPGAAVFDSDGSLVHLAQTDWESGDDTYFVRRTPGESETEILHGSYERNGWDTVSPDGALFSRP